MKNCSWCDTEFKPDVSYQIYCGEECRIAATKEKIALRYNQTKRQKRKGKVRLCKSCGEQLSIYNDDVLCNKCSIIPAEVTKALKDIRRLSNDK
jgi:hypothetical protein